MGLESLSSGKFEGITFFGQSEIRNFDDRFAILDEVYRSRL